MRVGCDGDVLSLAELTEPVFPLLPQVPSKDSISELQSCLRQARKLGAQARALRAKVQKNAVESCTPDAKEPTEQPW